MAPKNVFTAILCAMLLMWSSLAFAEEYKPEEFLGLDLSRAVLSKKPLGPAQEFAPVAVEARTDGASARGGPKAAATIAVPRTHVAHIRSAKPHGAVRTKLARRHGNPLDAQARDTRIQVWPCRSGGICNWQRQAN